MDIVVAFAGSGTLPLFAFASRFWLSDVGKIVHTSCLLSEVEMSESLLHLLSSGTWPHHPIVSVHELSGDR